jgi:hypothetical protein
MVLQMMKSDFCRGPEDVNAVGNSGRTTFVLAAESLIGVGSLDEKFMIPKVSGH